MSDQLVLDTSVVRSLAEIGGDDPHAMLDELFIMLFESASQQLEVIRQAAPENFDAVMRAGHTLKGGAGSVGAQEVAHIAAEIERRARMKQQGPWLHLANELDQALQRLRETLTEMGMKTAA